MNKTRKYSIIACLLCLGMVGSGAMAAGFGPGAGRYGGAGDYGVNRDSGTSTWYGGDSTWYGPGARGGGPCLNQEGANYGPGLNRGPNATFTYGPASALDICSADQVTFSGIVAEEALYGGGGITVDTGLEMVTVYGIGPFWYWQNLGIARPGVGDELEITAYNVTFSDGSGRLIADTVRLSGEESVALRDQSCLPLWRGGPRY